MTTTSRTQLVKVFVSKLDRRQVSGGLNSLTEAFAHLLVQQGYAQQLDLVVAGLNRELFEQY